MSQSSLQRGLLVENFKHTICETKLTLCGLLLPQPAAAGRNRMPKLIYLKVKLPALKGVACGERSGQATNFFWKYFNRVSAHGVDLL